MTLILGCSRSPESPPLLRLETKQTDGDTRVTLIVSSGLKLNARLKPALELADGTVLRFDSPRLTPDSAYFADRPSVVVPGWHATVHGTLRASVCDAGETVCRSIVVAL
jgi:hypothetical protein